MAKRKRSPPSRRRQSSSSNKRPKSSSVVNVDESDSQSTMSGATGSQAYVEEVLDSDDEEGSMIGNEPENVEEELGE